MSSIRDDPEWPGRAPCSDDVDPLDPHSLLRYAEKAPGDWRRWFYLGFRYDELCQADRAIGPYTRALALAPHVGLLHYLLGRAKMQVSFSDEAERHLIDAVDLRPDLVDAWVLLGAGRLHADRPAEALPALQQAVRLNSTGELYWQIGFCLMATDRLAEATVVFEEAVRLKLNHIPAHRALALLGQLRAEPDVRRRHLQRLFELNEDLARKVDEDLDRLL